MRTLPTALACVLATLALCGAASATSYGANEDHPKFVEDDGATMYGQLRDVGMTQNVLSVLWDSSRPDTIDNADRIARAIAAAQARGVTVVLAVYPATPRAIAEAGVAPFVSFCGKVKDTFPSVGIFIVGNEPNQPRFLQPQFNPDGSNASAAMFFQMLAGCYDVLHGAGKRVIGVGLSPRGNDRPDAVSNISTSPVRFIAALGAAYRASGRTTPIMDAFSIHPYANVNTDAPEVGFHWPNIGVPDMARLKQAIWDAFNGTGQPTVEEGTELAWDEVGWQVDTAGLPGYTEAENVPTVDAATQGRYHAEVVRRAACDPAIESLNFFHWLDEPDRRRFQSGALLRDGVTRRPSYDDIKAAIADTAGGTRCPAPFARAQWSHTTGVVNASAAFGNTGDKPAAQQVFAFSASADENAQAIFGLVKVDGPQPLTLRERVAVAGALRNERGTARADGAPAVALSREALLKAYFKPRLELRSDDLDRAYYVYAISLAAESNPSRKAFFASNPFQAGKGTAAGGAGPATKVNVTTGVASRVLLESAILNGSVKVPRGTKVEAWFEYGTTQALGRKTPLLRFTGPDPTVSAELRNILPRTKVFFRLVARQRGKPATETDGRLRQLTLTRPRLRAAPLVLVDDVDEQRRGVEVDALVSVRGDVSVAFLARRLPSRGAPGDARFTQRDEPATATTGEAGEDLFLTFEARLRPGTYLGKIVATQGGRQIERTFRFEVG